MLEVAQAADRARRERERLAARDEKRAVRMAEAAAKSERCARVAAWRAYRGETLQQSETHLPP